MNIVGYEGSIKMERVDTVVICIKKKKWTGSHVLVETGFLGHLKCIILNKRYRYFAGLGLDLLMDEQLYQTE